MTALSRDNIPPSITTLEGLVAWAILTYTAASVGTSYNETSPVDVQKLSSYGISPVGSSINGSKLFLIGRIAVPVENDLLADGTIAWDGVVENDGAVVLPDGYTV